MVAYTAEKTYPPANRCIYCGTEAGPLGREHIVPYALNGRLILPTASCRLCEKIINRQIESVCLSRMFRVARTHLQLQSKSGLPAELPIISALGDVPVDTTASFDTTKAAVKEHPMVFFMPGFAPPTAMFAMPPTYKLIMQRIIMYSEPQWQEKLAALGYSDPRTYIKNEIPFRPFARFLAKIAHAFLCAELPKDQFEPLLPDIILGKAPKDFKSHYVGGPGTESPGDIGKHVLNLTRVERFLVVEVSLFGSAPYQVVAGISRQ